MTAKRKALGDFGERYARERLEGAGYRIMGTKVRLPSGEIDIVAKDGKTTAFIEERTKQSRRFGSGEESITPAKQEKLATLASEYAEAHPGIGDDWRVDVIAIDVDGGGQVVRFAHHKNAIEEPGD
jgi:putative endonuclease